VVLVPVMLTVPTILATWHLANEGLATGVPVGKVEEFDLTDRSFLVRQY
jgi:hypothetical protein